MIAFLTEERGAVSVDWVVLTGAVVALGLAATAVVSSGIENLSGDVAAEMGIITPNSRFSSTAQGMGFEGGLGTWRGGVLAYDDGFGNVLRGGQAPGQAAVNTFDLEGDKAYAVIAFDMHAIDSWDGESFQVYVDNEVVATASFRFSEDGAVETWVSDNPDYTFSMETTTDRADYGFSGDWTDQSHRMQVTVANPGNQVTVGFGSTLDQGIDDESWAVDNLSIVETNDIY